MRTWTLALTLGALGCASEQDLLQDFQAFGISNPRPIPAQVQVDVIRQLTEPTVDVLWAVDTSSSMVTYAQKVSSNFPQFLEFFTSSGLDYHIGIISMNMDPLVDTHQGRLLEGLGYLWIDRETELAEEAWAEMVPYYGEVPDSAIHDIDEKGRAAILAALTSRAHDHHPGFLRSEAPLHIVAISDENDASSSPALSEFVAFLQNFRPTGALTFSSIVALEWRCAELGEDYITVTKRVGGFQWSICEEDWSPAIDAMGLHATGLDFEYYLSHLPVIETIDVKVLHEGITFVPGTDEWTYDGVRNSLTFDEAPHPLAEVHITYELRAAVDL